MLTLFPQLKEEEVKNKTQKKGVFILFLALLSVSGENSIM